VVEGISSCSFAYDGPGAVFVREWLVDAIPTPSYRPVPLGASPGSPRGAASVSRPTGIVPFDRLLRLRVLAVAPGERRADDPSAGFQQDAQGRSWACRHSTSPWSVALYRQVPACSLEFSTNLSFAVAPNFSSFLPESFGTASTRRRQTDCLRWTSSRGRLVALGEPLHTWCIAPSLSGVRKRGGLTPRMVDLQLSRSRSFRLVPKKASHRLTATPCAVGVARLGSAALPNRRTCRRGALLERARSSSQVTDDRPYATEGTFHFSMLQTQGVASELSPTL